MEYAFVKLQGAGNDFVFFDDLSAEMSIDVPQVRWLCDRHFGIGADGVILVRPSKRPECAAYMHYINADGSLAQMCGNGVRCFAKYLVDRGFVNADEGRFVADTLSGPKPITFHTDDQGKLVIATVDMGLPIVDPPLVPTSLEPNARTEADVPYVREAAIPSPWGPFPFTCVSMGNPHAVCFIDDFAALPDTAFTDSRTKGLATLDIDSLGSFFEPHAAFPEHANIEFATIDSAGISLRVFERGVGETLACGTGACATFVASVLTGRLEGKAEVRVPGGVLSLALNDEGHVLLTGPAEEAFEGTVGL